MCGVMSMGVLAGERWWRCKDGLKRIFVRKLFGFSSGLLRGFFANLRTICEFVPKKGKLSPEEGPKKSDLAVLYLIINTIT